MTLKDEPTLEDALDGLINAMEYCRGQDWKEESGEIAELYQSVGELSVTEADTGVKKR